MNGLLRYFFGYKTVTFKKEDTEKFYNFIYDSRITNWGYSSAEDNASLNIALTDYSYFENLARKSDIDFKESETKGLPGFFAKYKKRTGVWIGLFLCLLIICASSLFVWDVRIIGASLVSENEIIEGLKKEGLSVGSFIPSIKSTEICNSYLAKNDGLSWMSINPRGNVIYVEIIEESTETEENEKAKYANLVADEDAVIEIIRPSRGSVSTEVGKTVKKGDLLISGVYSSPRRYSFVYADGEVIGRVNRTLKIEIPFLQTEKAYKKPKISNISINFFGFAINIFRYTGKMPIKYDTIYRKEQIILFDRVKLPIYINTDEYIEYEDKLTSISESQAVEMAFNRLKSELSAITADAELVSKSIEGIFTEDSYILTCRAECMRNIATPIEFQAD